MNPATEPPTITVYSRPGCHLCERAWQELIALRTDQLVFELREINIETDDALHTAMLERIPVIDIDGEQICELGLDSEAVLARLGSLG